MTDQHCASLLALSVLLIWCALVHQTGSSSSSSRKTGNQHQLTASASARIQENHVINASLTSERFGPGPDEGVSAVCAYRVIEGGIWGQLCFRHTLFGYKCLKEDCRTQVSLGSLVANILINGSVLLQWSHEGDAKNRDKKTLNGTNSTRSHAVFGERRHRRGGYELSCWWNGSYTQFECASVHLGSGCSDFLLSELHENIPYRICLRSSPARSDPDQGAEPRDCVQFTLPPSGMQDIVIAMTTVGGAICVMLVIICLLVAYITENLMSPTAQHAYSYRSHSRH
uniref:Fibronectin type III domain containing 10 n=1 Tax=Iconisemion striatum TaxID=60296 RepID=A0A1A7WM49_9TELE